MSKGIKVTDQDRRGATAPHFINSVSTALKVGKYLVSNNAEALIEDVLIFGPLGLISLSNIWLLVLIGAIELWGIGSCIIIASKFDKEERVRASIFHLCVIALLVFVFFLSFPFIGSRVNFVKVWGPATVLCVAALVGGLPAGINFRKRFLPIAYLTLGLGLTSDLIISSLFLSAGNVSTSINVMEISIVSGIVIIVLACASIGSALLCNLAERFLLPHKKRLEKVSCAYLSSTAGFLIGLYSIIVPTIVLLVGISVVVILGWFKK